MIGVEVTRFRSFATLVLAVLSCLVLLNGCSGTAAPAKSDQVSGKQETPSSAKSEAPDTAKPSEKTTSSGEKYPARPIDFIVPWGPGGGADQLARKLSPLTEKILGAAMPVINVAGATGATGAAKMLASPADGYTILVFTADALTSIAMGGTPYTHKDFDSIIRGMARASFFFVNTDSPYKTWQDLEKAAKLQPGKVSVATAGEGSSDDLTVAYFAAKDVKMSSVPYPKPGERYAALLGGHADVLYEQAGDVRQFLTSGQIRPVIAFNEKRVKGFDNVPTSKELEYDILLPQFGTVVARKGTDPSKIKALGDAFKKAMDTPDWASFAEEQLMMEDTYMNPETVTKFLESEYNILVNLGKEVGLRK